MKETLLNDQIPLHYGKRYSPGQMSDLDIILFSGNDLHALPLSAGRGYFISILLAITMVIFEYLESAQFRSILQEAASERCRVADAAKGK